MMLAMTLLDVRRLAAIDMHGVGGTRLRRRVILAEFIVGALGCMVGGLWVAGFARGAGWRFFGVWLAGVGVNYVAVALHAVSLSRPGALDVELAGVDIGRELQRYTYLQFWVAVPLLFGVLAVRQVRRRTPPLPPT